MTWPEIPASPYLDIEGPGDARLRNSRIDIVVLIEDYLDGHLPEQMVLDYPSLDLATVYGVIAYYLENRAVMDEYARAWRELVRERETVAAAAGEFPVVARLRAMRDPKRAA